MLTMRFYRIRTGFTLIELLVVVAIISILIAILVPSLSSARKQAKQVLCMNNQKQIGMAIYMYQQDNNLYFPLNGLQLNSTTSVTWPQILMPYLSSEFLQSDPAAYGFPTSTIASKPIPKSFRCPEYHTETDNNALGGWYSKTLFPHHAMSYGYNYDNLGRWKTVDPIAVKSTMLTDPHKICMVDAGYFVVVYYSSGDPNILGRHLDKTNVLWADGSVSIENKVLTQKTRRWWFINE